MPNEIRNGRLGKALTDVVEDFWRRNRQNRDQDALEARMFHPGCRGKRQAQMVAEKCPCHQTSAHFVRRVRWSWCLRVRLLLALSRKRLSLSRCAALRDVRCCRWGARRTRRPL